MLIMGMFMGAIAIVMICIPLFMPLIKILGFSPLWFAILMLINSEISVTSPPYGINLFVMKGIAPPGTTTGDIYKAAVPFVLCNVAAIAAIMFIPQIALWLPDLVRF